MTDLKTFETAKSSYIEATHYNIFMYATMLCLITIELLTNTESVPENVERLSDIELYFIKNYWLSIPFGATIITIIVKILLWLF